MWKHERSEVRIPILDYECGHFFKSRLCIWKRAKSAGRSLRSGFMQRVKEEFKDQTMNLKVCEK